MLLLAVTLFAIPRKGLEYVPKNIQLAYIFTKALPRATSETLRVPLTKYVRINIYLQLFDNALLEICPRYLSP